MPSPGRTPSRHDTAVSDRAGRSASRRGERRRARCRRAAGRAAPSRTTCAVAQQRRGVGGVRPDAAQAQRASSRRAPDRTASAARRRRAIGHVGGGEMRVDRVDARGARSPSTSGIVRSQIVVTETRAGSFRCRSSGDSRAGTPRRAAAAASARAAPGVDTVGVSRYAKTPVEIADAQRAEHQDRHRHARLRAARRLPRCPRRPSIDAPAASSASPTAPRRGRRRSP